MDKVRVDRWLWAVRLTRTRSGAAQACRAGHVQVNGVRAKPAAPVREQDTVRLRVGDRERVVEVVRLIETRVGAEAAAGLARTPLTCTCPARQAWAAPERVLVSRTAHSQRSTRTLSGWSIRAEDA